MSSRVLVLNLPLTGRAPAAGLCSATPGEPVWLTLRSLAGDWTIPHGAVVHVCENPTVVEAAADRLGADCPPLVCTDGVPSFAALDLVEGLVRAGSRLHVRADVDDNGFVTVDQLRAVAPEAELWRFDATDYARRLGSDLPDTDADVDVRLGRLRRLFQRHDVKVHEESLLGELLDDLAAAAGRQHSDRYAPRVPRRPVAATVVGLLDDTGADTVTPEHSAFGRPCPGDRR